MLVIEAAHGAGLVLRNRAQRVEHRAVPSWNSAIAYSLAARYSRFQMIAWSPRSGASTRGYCVQVHPSALRRPTSRESARQPRATGRRAERASNRRTRASRQAPLIVIWPMQPAPAFECAMRPCTCHSLCVERRRSAWPSCSTVPARLRHSAPCKPSASPPGLPARRRFAFADIHRPPWPRRLVGRDDAARAARGGAASLAAWELGVAGEPGHGQAPAHATSRKASR
jgi:hypothetical protein